MKNSPESGGSWMVTVPIVLVAIGYFAVFYLPGRRAVAELDRQTAEKQQRVRQSGDMTGAIGQTEAQCQQTVRYVDQWRHDSPSLAELPAMMGRIQGLAGAVGATVVRCEPQQVTASAPSLNTLRRTPFVLECAGTMPQIYELLRSLENLPQAIWIEDLDLGKHSEAGKTASCEITMAVFTANSDKSD